LRAIDAAAKLGVRLGLDGEDRLALRNEVIACLALPDMQIIREWAGWPPGTVHVAFDGGQRRYVRISRAGDVSLREVEGDREVAHFTCATGACTSKFSHDGRYLSLYEDAGHKLRAWDLSADPPRVTVDEVSESDFHWDMSPNSRLMAFADPQGRVKLVDLATGTQTQSLEVGSKPRSLAFHPERRQLAVACGPGIVRICDVDSGAVLAELPHPNAVDALAWHPGGKVLATVARSRYIRLWDVAKQTENWKSSGPRNGGIMVAFNPTGDLLASFDWNSTLRLWNPLIGQQVFQTQIHMSQLNFKIDDDVLSGFNEETGTVGLFHVAAGREYRTLVRAPSIGDGAYHRVAVSPDGRMLAAGMEDGIGFWDFATGAPIEFIPAGTTGCVLFETDGGLLTKGPAGIFRWTFSADPAAPGILRCGAPERIPLPPSKNNGLACSRDGRIIASAHGNGGVVLHRGRRDWLVELAPHADVRFIALSPDEKWAVTGGHNGFGVKVWEAATGKLFRELIPDISLSAVGFSPDGNWLATTGGGVRLWHVNDWSEAAYLGGTAFAFSHDSRLMAVETGQGLVRLLEPATGRVVAQLDDPNRDVAGHMAFSPDNRQLVTSTNVNTGKIHVWNLELIRTRLAEMRFDWDLPSGGANRSGHEFPVAGDRLVDALNEWGQKQFAYGSSLRLVIDQEAVAEALRSPLPPLPPTSADLLRQGREHVGKREWAQAVVAFEMSLEQQPENDQSLNDLAWLLATCPEAAVRDPSRAVALARKALGVKPDEPNTWNSLGAALYRDERFREAIDALHKAEQLNPGSVFAFNGFFLAMAHHQLGESVPARDWLARSETWLDRHRVELSTEHQDELSRFRREARELIEPEANVP
jgi:WD40 repeat protein